MSLKVCKEDKKVMDFVENLILQLDNSYFIKYYSLNRIYNIMTVYYIYKDKDVP